MATPQLTVADQHGHRPLVPENVRGFLAGVASGIGKMMVGHPFDTIKVRLQTSTKGQFRGPVDCLLQTARKEGLRAVYKGATPPLVGWMAMDSVMLGSLSVYRRLLRDDLPVHPIMHYSSASEKTPRLTSFGHGIAGIMAGWTVQYAAAKKDRLYSGPIDCIKKIYQVKGVRGVYHGLTATLIFRSYFFFWWSTYDIFTRWFQSYTALPTPAINFWAGGLSAQVFWLTCYPSDVVKQRILTDPLGGALKDGTPKFPRWRDAARAVYVEQGWRGYWRGFLPCFLRAFPANATALLAFESVMRLLG